MFLNPSDHIIGADQVDAAVRGRRRWEDRERRRQRTAAVLAGGSSWPVKTYRQSGGGLINSQFINYFLNPILIMRKEFY